MHFKIHLKCALRSNCDVHYMYFEIYCKCALKTHRDVHKLYLKIYFKCAFKQHRVARLVHVMCFKSAWNWYLMCTTCALQCTPNVHISCFTCTHKQYIHCTSKWSCEVLFLYILIGSRSHIRCARVERSAASCSPKCAGITCGPIGNVNIQIPGPHILPRTPIDSRTSLSGTRKPLLWPWTKSCVRWCCTWRASNVLWEH